MALDSKYERKHDDILKDVRPKWERRKDKARDPSNAVFFFTIAAVVVYIEPMATMFADIIFATMSFYFYWLLKQPDKVPFKLPKSANIIDPNYKKPDGSPGMAEGILYLGNTAKGQEVWFNNNDARTHFLYLGTTGAGKTFGLKSIICNALCWSSGYVYIDGKADTDLWSTLSALARRFGRDDDLLLMNYMTGNASGKVPSNTLNPFSSGSASYLTNMLTSLMPDSGGDNAMWKERAISLISAIMPILVWKRDNQSIPLSIGVIRNYLTFQAVIKLSRDKTMPEMLRKVVRSYLDELPGYVDDIFDDDGNEKPGNENADTSTPRQQHGFLSMQFTRAMSSLGEDYGFIFDTQAADIDMTDVVLNRRLLITLIPALEKSGDETANLGKIISSALKGMMGATLGNTVEGDTATAIENKPTTSSTPFIAVFDEVGYYAAQGMAVMAAQARSLGFCLIFAGQDMPALEKRVKEEARSITANCNIKLFGKLEDPTQTKEFFEKSVGQALVTEISGYEKGAESKNVSIQTRSRASYEELKYYSDGQAICTFGKAIAEIKIYNHDIGHAKAMRIHHFLPLVPPSEETLSNLQTANNVVKRLRDPKWMPENEAGQQIDRDIEAMAKGFTLGLGAKTGFVRSGALAIAQIAHEHGLLTASDVTQDAEETKPVKAVAEEAQKQISAEDIFTPKPEVQAPVSNPRKVEPISWAELIGMDSVADAMPEVEKPVETVAEAAPATNPFAAYVQPAEPVPASTVPPALTAAAPVERASIKPLTWAELIGMESVDERHPEPIETPIATAPIAVPESIPEPIVAPAPMAEPDFGSLALEKPEPPKSYMEAAAEQLNLTMEATSQPVAKPEPVSAPPVAAQSVADNLTAPMTWQQLVGGAKPEAVAATMAPTAPVAENENVGDGDDKEEGSADGSGKIQTVSWGDIIGVNSAH